MPDTFNENIAAPNTSEAISPPLTLKECSHCHTLKPTTDYHKHATARDGLQYYCRDCQREHKKKYIKSRTCRVCKTSKPLSEYHKCKTDWLKRQKVCKQCRRDYSVTHQPIKPPERPVSPIQNLIARLVKNHTEGLEILDAAKSLGFTKNTIPELLETLKKC